MGPLCHAKVVQIGEEVNTKAPKLENLVNIAGFRRFHGF